MPDKKEMHNQDLPKKELFKQWLEKLQQESWQLELIISGFAIFGLFNAKAPLFAFIDTLTDNVSAASTYSTITGIGFLLISVALFFGWHIFVFNLIVHVLVRGLWIGAIGLRYVSGDINYDSLKYNKLFTEHFRAKTGSFDNYIAGLERLASVLFGYTFLLFFMVASFLLLILLFLCIAFLFSTGEHSSDSIHFQIEGFISLVFLIIFVLSGLLVLFDFISLGMLKKIKQKHFAKYYFYTFRFFSFITLSFLWRPLLLNFLDTKYTRMLFLFSVPYCFIIAFVLPSLEIFKNEYYPTFDTGSYQFSLTANKHSYHYQYYDEERLKMEGADISQKINFISIPSKRVSGNFLELFIKAHDHDDLLMRENSKIFPLSKKGIINTAFFSIQHKEESLEKDSADTSIRNSEQIFEENLITVKSFLTSAVSVKIDHEKISNDSIFFDFYLHPYSQNKGLLAYIPINKFKNGKHTIYVTKKIGTKESKDSIATDSLEAAIPFLIDR